MKGLHIVAALAACVVSLLVGASPAFASPGDLLAMTGLASAASLYAPAALAGGVRLTMTAAERAKGRFMRAPDGHDTKTVDQLVEEVKSSVEKATDKAKEIAENALGKAEAGEELSKSAKEKADEALIELSTLKGQFTELEQKLAEVGHGRDEEGRTAGEVFIEDEKFKAFAGQKRPRGRCIVEVKDITSLTTNAPGSVGALVPQAQVAVPVMLPQRRMTIRALLASGQMSGNTIEYDREVLFDNQAAPVAEGAAKPQSELQFEDATATARTVAHWMRTSVQILDDAPALRSIIDNRLRYGLAYQEEVQLLTGDGTGQNLDGLVTNATAYAAPGALTAANPLEVLRLMILQVVLAEFPANGIVLNPIDMTAIELTKDANDRYILGQPQDSIVKRLWGLPVVETQAITEDKALVGAFDLAAQIFDRQDATVETSTEDGDNFTKNKVTIRAEERLALAIYRPASIVYGDLGRVV